MDEAGSGHDTHARRGAGATAVDDGPITMKGLDDAIRQASRGRAADLDDIPVEAWAAMARARAHLLDLHTSSGERRLSPRNGRRPW